MNTAIFAEVEFFFASFLWGAFLFLLYDGILIFRNIIKHGTFLISFEDICFWITAGVLIFRMMYIKNNGTIRWYAVVGIILGMNLYHYTFSRLIIKVVTKTLKAILTFIKRVIHILLTPVRILVKYTKKIGKFFIGKCKKRGNQVNSFLQKQLKKHREKVTIKKKVKEEKKQQRMNQKEQQKEQAALPEVKKGCLERIRQPEEKGEVIEIAKKEKKKKKNRA